MYLSGQGADGEKLPRGEGNKDLEYNNYYNKVPLHGQGAAYIH
jgi:hypothetical protein